MLGDCKRADTGVNRNDKDCPQKKLTATKGHYVPELAVVDSVWYHVRSMAEGPPIAHKGSVNDRFAKSPRQRRGSTAAPSHTAPSFLIQPRDV